MAERQSFDYQLRGPSTSPSRKRIGMNFEWIENDVARWWNKDARIGLFKSIDWDLIIVTTGRLVILLTRCLLRALPNIHPSQL